MKVHEILESIQALNKLSDKEGYSIELNFLISRNCKALRPIVEDYQDAVNKFLKEHGVYDTKLGRYVLSESNADKHILFHSLNESLLNKEIDNCDLNISYIDQALFDNTDTPANLLTPILYMINSDRTL